MAGLVQQGLFKVVFSTNADDLLEKAFITSGMKEWQDFTVFFPERHSSEDIVFHEILQTCKLIKLSGDLQTLIYHLGKSDAQVERCQSLRNLLEKMGRKEVLVVGVDPVWDASILSAFPLQVKTVWLVNEDESVKDAFVSHSQQVKYIRYIVGADGGYEKFFKEVLWYVDRGIPRNFPASVPPVQQYSESLDQQRRNTTSPSTSAPSRPTTKPPPKNKVTADVLLVTVTPVEAKAILNLFPGAEQRFIGNGTYHELGLIGQARTFMIQSPHMGSGGPGGSRFTVDEGIETLSPWAVIMVGIAFGFKPKVQRIGDILVSEQILDYDPQRVGSGPGNQELIYPRGNRAMASVRLLDRFTSGQHFLPADWQNLPKIYFGLVLSGAKLVDNKSYRDQLLQIAPEAIGGEMEGAGLHDAASRSKVDWVLVKGICDWADGKKYRHKSQNQQLAAENAARFVIHEEQVLYEGDVQKRYHMYPARRRKYYDLPLF